MDSPGRREQNKLRTREAIKEAATRLFDDKGFANTTVRDIAQAAGVGERTFFRYFPTKESLVTTQIRELVPRLAQLLRDRPADEAPYQALRMAVLDLVGQHDVPPAVFITGSPGRLSPDEPAPRHDHFLLSDMEESIAEVLAERLRTTDGGEDRLLALRAAVKARAGLAALRGLIAVDSSTPGAGTLSIEDLTLRVNEAFLALED